MLKERSPMLPSVLVGYGELKDRHIHGEPLGSVKHRRSSVPYSAAQNPDPIYRSL